MTDPLAALPSHLRRKLAHALDTGAVSEPYSECGIQMAVGRPEPLVLDSLRRLAARGITNRGAAWPIRALDDAAATAPALDLVWSGPEVPDVPARDTRAVCEELFASARRSLWAVSYAYFDGPRVFEPLARRMEERPELRVTLLLNIHRGPKDATIPEDVVRRFADRFWSKDWPGEARPAVYYDPRSVDPESRGVLHAKAVVADEERVFITSANLTGAAQDKNIELGVRVGSRPLALRVVRHLQGLIDRGMLSALPGE